MALATNNAILKLVFRVNKELATWSVIIPYIMKCNSTLEAAMVMEIKDKKNKSLDKSPKLFKK